jgi:hypothetical protein
MTWHIRNELDIHDDAGMAIATAVSPEAAARVVGMAAENERLKAKLGELYDQIDSAIEQPGQSYYDGLNCGVEDRDITNRYEAAAYGWDQAFEYIASCLPERDAAIDGERGR